ncbi:MAG: pyridoxamine 5'-phosphate oxidase [Acidimicrobiales bacterium]|jgi:pyridoxamine 5'-phosphate oxidase
MDRTVSPGSPGSPGSPDDRSLDERTVDRDPLAQFGRWYGQAAGVVDAPEAMAVATADADGRPSVRMVLLKSWGADGFVFYTNFDGRKSLDLSANPEAALLFYWEALGRQVRIEGPASRTTDAESDAYFASRPAGSRIGAYASHQSRPVGSRVELDAAVDAWTTRFGDGDVPRPPWWGGWRVAPRAYEFWQLGRDRLHDRVRYDADGAGWVIRRLQP